MRVALLARPGAACDKLLEALRDARAEVVLVADPTAADPKGVLDAGAQAVLVALEPSVEDALERFEPLLSDPAVTVIYDEAELAASRAGWDAARWVRHLAAKLHRHGDVLPPGAEAEDPGFEVDIDTARLELYQPPESDGDLSGIADEAASLAGEVPRDGLGFDAPLPSFQPSAAPEAEIVDLDAMWRGGDATDADADDDAGLDIDFGASGAGASDPAPAAGAEVDTPMAGFSLGELALVDDEESPPAAATPAPGSGPDAQDDPLVQARFDQDMHELNTRTSGLELVDAPRFAQSQVQGAVLVLAGIGGPDAVRQLLGALPARFSRAVLVQQRLDGARHDKLVRQMQRATEMPVELAEAGKTLQAGHVYILPADVTIRAGEEGAAFAPGAPEGLLPGLPPGDSAVVLLSGTDPDVVDAAMALAAQGTLVAGQSPDGCYDAAAAQALVARGAQSGGPAELARMLAARWTG